MYNIQSDLGFTVVANILFLINKITLEIKKKVEIKNTVFILCKY